VSAAVRDPEVGQPAARAEEVARPRSANHLRMRSVGRLSRVEAVVASCRSSRHEREQCRARGRGRGGRGAGGAAPGEASACSSRSRGVGDVDATRSPWWRRGVVLARLEAAHDGVLLSLHCARGRAPAEADERARRQLVHHVVGAERSPTPRPAGRPTRPGGYRAISTEREPLAATTMVHELAAGPLPAIRLGSPRRMRREKDARHAPLSGRADPRSTR